jgi:dihydrodipicolinate synthase/N-acetylneuraminate lyase
MCERWSGNKDLSQRLVCLSGGRHAIGRRLFFWGGIMSNQLYRAQRCRDLAEECRAIAALCTPSTEMRTHYSRMSEHYSSLAEAEELGMLAYCR